MTRQIFISITFLTLFFSCEPRHLKEQPEHPNWITLTLPNGWQLLTPNDFKDTTVQGVDSDPGYIYSKSESIMLYFDSGAELLPKEDCDFNKQLADAKRNIDFGFYKDFYKVPTLHKAFIDTIDNKIATFVIPTQTGKGTVGISISDCETGLWLGIRGQNLNTEQEKLVLEILQTLKLKNNEP
jgi:hypothetical protein